MLGGDLGVLRIAGQAIEAVQHLPARRQGGVQVDGEQQALDGARRVLEADVAEAPLLMQPAEPGLGALQPVEHLQRLGNALQVAQAGGGDQQKVTVLRRARQDGLCARQRLGVATLLLKSPKPDDVLLDPGRR